MTRQELINQCLLLPDSYEDYPFHDANWTVIRHRKNRKVFAWIFEKDGKLWINLKTTPQGRDFWRQAYGAIIPAYHLNKEHWNSVILDGTVPRETLLMLIGESYDLVKPAEKKGKKA